VKARPRASVLRFHGRQAIASIRTERTGLRRIRLNADLVTDEQMTICTPCLRPFPRPVPHAIAPGNPQRSETGSTW